MAINKLNQLNAWQIALALVLIMAALAGYWGYERYRLLEDELRLEKEGNVALSARLEEAKKENLTLEEVAANQQAIIDSFQGQIQDIGKTVGTLEKLAQTDKELLRKYSKVYFLNENYVPAKLTQVEKQYILKGAGDNFLIHADVWPNLERLLDEARSDDIELLIASAFRSFGTQASLKADYKVTYGAGTANQFSADQGYSEHQLGTSVDFTTPALGSAFTNFKSDPAYEWLKDNAHQYGFVLSYPEGNTFYKFEPWHWRFVGVDLAKMLHREDKYFYDLDQREIDTYLIKLFD
jgi:D-alanyl-D-alanine carboxypeptidase